MIRIIQMCFILLLLTGCSLSSIESFNVPDHFSFAEEVVKTIEKNNIEVTNMQNSTMESLFKKVYDAAFIETSIGAIDVVYVTDADPRELIIIPQEDGYTIKQFAPLLDHDLMIGTTSESYFIQTEKFFMHTKSRELYSILKNFESS